MKPENPIKLRPQAGSIAFDGLEATKFWLRTFNLTDIVNETLAKFTQVNPTHDRISCPIISEYRVNEDLLFTFVILCTCDRIGLIEGAGQILYASPSEEKRVLKRRDELADSIMDGIQKKPHSFEVIEGGKEKERDL